MRREKLEYLVTTAMTKENAARENSVNDVGWTKKKWLKLKVGQVTDALKATGERYAWKVMMAFAREQGTRLID